MQIQLKFKENLKWHPVTINALKKGLTEAGIIIMNNLIDKMPTVTTGLSKGNRREVKSNKNEVYLRIWNIMHYAPYI